MTYFFAILMLFSFLISSSSFYFPCKKLRHPNVNELAIELVQQLEKLKSGSPIARQEILLNGKILIAFDESNIFSIIENKNIYNAHYLKNLNPDDTYASRMRTLSLIKISNVTLIKKNFYVPNMPIFYLNLLASTYQMNTETSLPW